MTALGHAGNASTSVFHKPYATSAPHSDCSKNCTYDWNLLTSNHHTWSKCLGTAIIGRVHYLVDPASNRTITSTSYAEDLTFISHGMKVTSLVSDILARQSEILTRTDVNAAVTVTYFDGTNTM